MGSDVTKHRHDSCKIRNKKTYKAVISKNSLAYFIDNIYTIYTEDTRVLHNHSCFCSLISTQDRGIILHYMGVSKNRCTPKWMVKIMENPIEMEKIWGGKPTIFGNIHICLSLDEDG